MHQLVELRCNIEQAVYEFGPAGFALARGLADAGFTVSAMAASRLLSPILDNSCL
ncbi:MAG: hypothetical protein AAF230_05475 [Pseudomonadota bacterium]